MKPRIIPFIVIALFAPFCRADLVELSHGGSLSGDVLSIQPDGKLNMAVPIAKKPLEIRSTHIKSISFLPHLESDHYHDAMFTLINGDRLPGDLLAIDADHVTAKTSYSDQFKIPRDNIFSIKTGLQPRAMLYANPMDQKYWTNMENWTLDDQAITTTERGHAACKLDDLPMSFSLTFNITWIDNPNLKIHFCSDNASPNRRSQNRYYLQFNRAGFEIKRESEGKNPYNTLGIIDRKPSDFPNKTVQIEIRVDRNEQKILFFINGKLQGSYHDKIEPVPKGEFMIFSNNERNTETISVSKLVVRQWDMTTERHHSEDRGMAEVDSIIDYEGQRFGGTLVKTSSQDNDLVVLFKSPHYPEALEIPKDDISIIFFQSEQAEDLTTPWALKTRNGGHLHFQSVTLTADGLTGSHPYLGNTTIPNANLKFLTYQQAKPKKEN